MAKSRPGTSKILCVVGELTGLYRASLELCRRLRLRGHEVVLASPRLEGSEKEGPFGINCVSIPADGFQDFLRDDRTNSRVSRLLNLQARKRAAEASLHPDTVKALIEHLDPDLVLIDLELHQHVFAALGTARRVALLNTWLSIRPDPDVPPLHLAMTPDDGAAQIRKAWARHALYKRRRAVSERMRDVGGDWRSALMRIAQVQGVPVGRFLAKDTWLYPFAYRNLPMLTLHASELDFPRKTPDDAIWTGPMVPKAAEAEMPAALKALLKGKTGPVIYGGFGSFFTAEGGLLEQLWQVFRNRLDWALILSRGGTDHALPAGAPDNVHVFDSLPQPEVIAACDAAIVHGGINTIDECILGQTPMLVCSGDIVDMPGNAARVVWHGVGMRADPREEVAERLDHRLEQVLADRAIQEKLTLMSRAFRRYERDGVAEEAIDGLLQA